MRHLILRLEAPLMSFGDTAIDERLPTARFPSLSMVCGLLANAAGMCRTRPEEIQALQDVIQIASRIDRPGERLHDYQTAQVDAGDKIWTSTGRVSGREGGASGAMTILISKEYWADAAVTTAVGVPDDRIDDMAAALMRPARVLFLGRACCVPSCRILQGIAEGADVLEALEAWPSDTGAPVTMFAQWPHHIERPGRFRDAMASDRKDWKSRIHTGLRRVREADIQVGTTA